MKKSMINTLSVSIIIATAGRASSLDRTLLSLRQLRYPLFEVIIVLGPSTDHSMDVVAKYADFVRLYSIDKLNLSAARNVGLSMARGDIVAFIDDDAVPEPDWLEQLLTGFEDPNVAQVGGFIRDNRGIDYQCKYLAVDRFGDSVAYDDMPKDLDRNRYLGLTGTNFSVRRDLLMAMGGFDEEYAYFLDETDVTVRLIDQGWDSRIVPNAEIHHKFEPSHLRTENRVPKSMYATARSKAYFCCVHGGKQYSLDKIFSYLGDFIRKERAWKTDLFRHGHTDMATVDRLIGEVERGVSDGVHDAFFYQQPRGVSAELLATSHAAIFKNFPLPLPATERLRICFLSQDYPPSGSGGIGQWTREMATGLAERGHEVTVICRSEFAYPYIDFIDGVWVHRIVSQPEGGKEVEIEDVPVSLLGYSASAYAEIQRIQPHRQFHIVSGPIFDLEPLVALRRSVIPTVVSLHTTYKLALPFKPDWRDDIWYRKSFVNKIIDKEKEILESAPYILSNTQALMRDLLKEYNIKSPKGKISVINHGIKDLSYGIVPFQKKLGRINLLFVGRLELRKGADILLRIIPGLLRTYPELEVDFVGDDSLIIDHKTLRQEFEGYWQKDDIDISRVTFHGLVPRADVLRHYASCDIFVAPSRYESFGLTFVEAMIFAKPVIGIAVGGVVDVVTHGVDGLLIERDDPVLLADAIGRLVHDPVSRVQMGQAGRRTYEARFHVEKMLSATEEYFQFIAQKAI